MEKAYLIFILAYLLGSIPTALLVAKPFGIDPRKHGSKNLGATNVARLLGKKWGLLTLLGDMGKGIIPMLLALYFFKNHPQKDFLVAGVGFFAFLGHLFPIYLKFRGGKGVATAAGVFLMLCPVALAIALVVFILAVKITGFVSVGSLLASALVPCLIPFICPNRIDFYTALIMAALIWFKHRDNIRRLIRGEEKSWEKNQN
ncbi:glycerol-3-phosphate 1-O-acyltransferase PlsY [Thermodesulfatator autotrophicus]|uniref:Glycerol-3-phosphate acyltransferase n=1 Tax=Thermodesulfatator autotrophicus TaxID=1795632 RepID=A0A177E796_9BACT|nr:glycerol-3-phosphate 1-O-acyltransferase PlsY [Thermodesulfatator autotrophicus]OAG27814.1 acyl-phosphate glycerol 3-phosphate acyltransferase [Thermodesulfatator autotrophicus]